MRNINLLQTLKNYKKENLAQFIFGVDAAPAALIGAALLNLHIESGSKEALAVVPGLTLLVAVWLFAFYLMKAGKLVNYISAPVMGGFITGICTTIILMQLPKLMGGSAGTGELPELALHIAKTFPDMNVPSLILGQASLGILLQRNFGRKFRLQFF